MPKGPQGQKRPADAIARAVLVAKIATGEVEDSGSKNISLHARAGKEGGKARAASLLRTARYP
jgi:hypothetical protein